MTLFPNNPLPADLMRPLSISLATPLYLLFCIELLRIKKEIPFYYRWMMRGLVVYFAIFLISIPFLFDIGKTRVLLQNLMQVLLTVLVLCNLCIAIIASGKKIRYAVYIIISSAFLLLTISFFVLYLSGDIVDNLFTRNLMNIGFMGEISLLAFVVSLRFKHYKEQFETLLRKSNLEQEQIFKSVTDYQEKELQRLSSLLHDSVGARLSALRFNLESGIGETGHDSKLKNSIIEINDLANEIRMFSHNLSPVLLQKKGLREALEQFIKPINESGKLWVQFEMIGSSERTLFRYELMVYNIIQELVQNIIKHSGATEAIIQLIVEENLVSIYTEDNGKGFDSTIKKDGLGLSQIKQLVIFVNGSFQIHSSKDRGSRISIEFITLPNERKHPDNHS
jgi:signal transduction histidine kinase